VCVRERLGKVLNRICCSQHSRARQDKDLRAPGRRVHSDAHVHDLNFAHTLEPRSSSFFTHSLPGGVLSLHTLFMWKFGAVSLSGHLVVRSLHSSDDGQQGSD